jgi:hypothetical protein
MEYSPGRIRSGSLAERLSAGSVADLSQFDQVPLLHPLTLLVVLQVVQFFQEILDLILPLFRVLLAFRRF